MMVYFIAVDFILLLLIIFNCHNYVFDINILETEDGLKCVLIY